MKEGITTKTAEKKEIPEGNWYKCPSCKTVIASAEHEENLWVCGHCDHHERIGSSAYFNILFDGGKFRELQAKMMSANPLDFKDTKGYEDRLASSMEKTGLKDAIRTGVGEVAGRQMVVSCMDFGFIGGSMGSVVGEKIARAVDYAIKNGLPYVCITKIGRCPHDGGRTFVDADGQDECQAQPAGQGRTPLHLYPDRPNDRWRDGIFRHAW